MIGFFVRLLSGRFGGFVLGAIVSVLLAMSGYIGWQAWDRHALRTEVAETKNALADARLQVELMRVNRDRLADRLASQTEHVRQLELAAEQVQEQAGQAAREVIADAESKRQADAAISGDPEAMNAWLRELFY